MIEPHVSAADGAPGASLGWQPMLVAGAAVIVALLCAALAWDSAVQRAWLAQVWLYKRPHGVEEVLVCAVVSAAAALSTLRSVRRGRARVVLAPSARWIPPIVAAAWMASWSLTEVRRVHDLRPLLGYSLAAWNVLVAVGAQAASWPRALATLEKLLLVAALSLFTTEIALRAWRAAAAPELLATPSLDAGAFVAAYRRAPGRDHSAFPSDEHGYSDRVTAPLGPDEPWVACIGDSFSVGAVPHHRHYTTLAERELGCEVYNVGVACAGPREYLHMLREHVLPRRPRLVVISIFIGNDFEDSVRGRSNVYERFISGDEVLVRVAALRAGKLLGARDLDTSARSTALPAQAELAKIEQAMPWLADPRLEPPAFSAERFARIEIGRAEWLLKSPLEACEPLFEWLARIREAAAPIPVACLLIPDEFQVEDAVWESVCALGLDPALDRELPQRRLRERLTRDGFEYVDLLPALRAVPPLEDGRRHVYHLRETHFNARGNEVAAHGLVDLVRRFVR